MPSKKNESPVLFFLVRPVDLFRGVRCIRFLLLCHPPPRVDFDLFFPSSLLCRRCLCRRRRLDCFGFCRLAVKSKGAEKPAKGRKGKAGKDPNKPKRAPSAFFVFM